jgi:hypothetical protein
MAPPKITKIEIEGFAWNLKGMTRGRGGHYDPDGNFTREYTALRIHADNGAVGEYAGLNEDPARLAAFAESYIGTNALDREFHYQRGKAIPTTTLMAALDLGLWDL